MKILTIITRLNIGGPAVQVISLTKELQKYQLQSSLVCGHIGKGEGDMSYLANNSGIRPIYISSIGREVSLIKDIIALVSLIKIINKSKPDIIHTHTAKAGTLGRVAAFIINIFSPDNKKIRIVHTFHGHIFNNYFNNLKAHLFQLVERLLSKCTDCVIAISPSQKNDLCYRYGIAPENKVSVIPLGFDLSRFRKPLDSKKNTFEKWLPELSEKKFIVGVVGRLTAIKNPRMIIKVAKYLETLGRGHEFHYFFIGDGELKAELMNEVSDAGLENRIIFTGWRKDISAIYHGLDAVLLSSLNEGTPVSLIEAMAAGKIVIATNVGGVKDLMGLEVRKTNRQFSIMENGILVDSQDEHAMALALIHVHDEREAFEKKAKAVAQRIVKKYSNQRILKDTIKLYEKL